MSDAEELVTEGVSDPPDPPKKQTVQEALLGLLADKSVQRMAVGAGVGAVLGFLVLGPAGVIPGATAGASSSSS